VVYTYWRQEELLWERLATLDPKRLATLRRWTAVLGAGWLGLATMLVLPLYVDLSSTLWWTGMGLVFVLIAVGTLAYLGARPAARRLVWPSTPVPPASLAPN